MAHRISIQNGRAEFAYTGSAPWHGLGTAVPAHMSPAEAQQKVLGWTVSTRPVAFASAEGGAFDTVAGRARAIVRDDIKLAFGIATETYQPIQNAQAADVADALIAEGAKCVETVGALDDGARCFMLLALDKTGYEVRKGDTVQSYMLLRWGHDGRTMLSGKLTKVRVVCHNTLTAAGPAYAFNIKHTASAKLRVEDAREALGVARKAYSESREAYRAMAAVPVGAQAKAYFAGVLPIPKVDGAALDALARPLTSGEEEKLGRWEATQRRLLALYSGQGKGLGQGSAWDAYNAVTEWLDHVYPVTSNGEVSVNRQESVLFGAYADVRSTAYTAALALAK